MLVGDVWIMVSRSLDQSSATISDAANEHGRFEKWMDAPDNADTASGHCKLHKVIGGVFLANKPAYMTTHWTPRWSRVQVAARSRYRLCCSGTTVASRRSLQCESDGRFFSSQHEVWVALRFDVIVSWHPGPRLEMGHTPHFSSAVHFVSSTVETQCGCLRGCGTRIAGQI